MTRLTVFLMSLVAVSLLFIGQGSAQIDPETVVGMWLFEEGHGSIAEDSSGKENHGAISGPVEWVAAKFGQGLEFNGTNTWVEVQSNDTLVLEELTMVAWAKLNESKGTRWQSIMMKGQNPRNYLLCVDKDTQTLQLSITKGAPDQWAGPIGGPEITDGEWHHLAGVIGEEAGLVIFTDGVQVGQQDYSTPSLDATPDVLRIGDGSAGGHQVDGILDEVAIFNVPLELEDIQEIMDEGLGKVIVTIEGLIAHKERCFTSGGIDNRGVANSLDQKLEAAKATLDRGQPHVAANILGAFINEVEAQSGKHISPECADLLTGYAGRLISVLTDVPQAPSRRPIVAPVDKLANLWGKLKAK